jgi:predicted AlkP superfamily phosphohydrolase/phosphomutase
VSGVDPAAPPVAEASLATGAFPSKTSIVGDHFHRPEDSFYWYTEGYVQSPLAEPIWVAARRAGLKTAVLFWGGITPENQPDLALRYGKRDAYSNEYRLSFAPSQGWVNTPETFSPALQSRFQITDDDRKTLKTIYVLAVDSTDDGVTTYDQYLLSDGDQVVEDDDLTLHGEGEWASWLLDPAAGQGADFLITSAALEDFRLFQSRVYRLSASPEDFQQAAIARLSFFPPPPDDYALEHGWIDETQYLSMMSRQSTWMMAATAWVYQDYHPDLLMTIQSSLAQAGRRFLLVDERQPGYDPQRAAEYATYRKQAAVQLDGAIQTLVETAGSDLTVGKTALFIVGTTGMTPIYTQVNLNRLLTDSGWLVLDERRYVIVESSKVIAFASGGTAHLYIHLAGRERAGIVPPEDFEQVESEIIALLETLTDPATGEPIFARIVRGSDLYPLGLDGAYAGDIFVEAAPGYTLSDDRGAETIFEPASYYGEYGYDPNRSDMRGGLLIAGRGARPGTAVRLIDLAPTIARLLGFGWVEVDGEPIPWLITP